MKKLLFCLCGLIFFSCNYSDHSLEDYNKKNDLSGSSTIASRNPYEVMETAFEGYPAKGEIQPMLEYVMKRYGMSVNDDNLLKAANVLVAMKNASKIGVTEMDILKHVYQHGSASGDYVTNVALSATILEETK